MRNQIIHGLKYHQVFFILGAYVLGILGAYHGGYVVTFSLLFLVVLSWFIGIFFRRYSHFLPIYVSVGCFAYFYTLSSLSAPSYFSQSNEETFYLTVTSPIEATRRQSKCYAVDSELNRRFLVYLPRSALNDWDLGDTLHVTAAFKPIDSPRNPGGFDYAHYLRLQGISGVLMTKTIHDGVSGWAPFYIEAAHWIRSLFLKFHYKSLDEPYSTILIGLIFGKFGIHLPSEVQESFQRVGLMHLLVVSGSQVSLLSGICLSVFQQFIRKKWLLFVLVSIVNGLFLIMTGGEASIFRAVLMNECAVLLMLTHRRTYAPHVLALVALIMLVISPLSLFNIGAQISFMATLSLIYGATIIRDRLRSTFPSFISSFVSIIISPFVFTFPLLWFHFNTISILSLLSNALVIVWIEWLVVLGFASSVIGLGLFPLGFIINQCNRLLMQLLLMTTSFLETIPYGNLSLERPSWVTVLAIYAAIFFMFYCLDRRFDRQLKWTSSIGLCLLTIGLMIRLSLPSPLKVIFFDVGQGDATLIQTPKGKTILIDAGLISRDFHTNEVINDMGKAVLLPAFRFLGINRLDVVIITHFDSDHVGGLHRLIREIPIAMIIDNGSTKSNLFYDHDLLTAARITRYSATGHQRLKFGESMYLDIVNMFHSHSGISENDRSLVLKFTYKDLDILFTGDLERLGEHELIQRAPFPLKSDVLQVGHHGSRTSSDEAFLSVVQPSFAIISAGQKNRYGHPAPDVVTRLKTFNAQIYRTDHHGAIEIESDGKTIQLKTPYYHPSKFVLNN